MPFSRTEPNVPAYEEDPNSPFEATNQSSVTFTLADSPERALVINDPARGGFTRLQVNGLTSEYDSIDVSGTETRGQSAFPVIRGDERSRLYINGGSNVITVHQVGGRGEPDDMVNGRLTPGSSTTIDTITLFTPFTTTKDTRLRVYALDV